MKVELNEMKDKITGMEGTQGRMEVRQDYFSSLQLRMEMNLIVSVLLAMTMDHLKPEII
jgi:hypothetical protein